MKADVAWFRDRFIRLIGDGYKFEYTFFKDGDFGDLDRVEFEGNEKGGNVDFWSSGWLNIHLVDYKNEGELLNVLLEPHQEKEQEQAFEKLQSLL